MKPTCVITATPNHIHINEDPLLEWSSTNATSATLNQGIGAVPVNGTYNVFPSVTTTYTLTVSGPGGTAQCSTTVTVTYEPPTCAAWADPQYIFEGDSSRIYWDSINGSSATINQGIGSVSLSGNRAVGPLWNDTTYTVTVQGQGGTVQCPVTIYVTDVPDDDVPACDIWADDTTLEDGQSTMLRWSSQNASSASLSQFGSVSVNGSRSSGALWSTQTFTLTVWGNGGTSQCSVTIVVDEPDRDPPTCSIWADDTSLDDGETTTIRWSSSNATSASLSQFGGVPANGTRSTGALWSTTTYTLWVSGEGGSAQCHVTITVSGTPDRPSCALWANPTHVQRNGSSTLNWTTTGNATSASIDNGVGSVSLSGSRSVYDLTYTRTYTMTVWGSGGSSQCQTTITVDYGYETPSCSIWASPSNVQYGASSSLTWNSQNAVSATLSNVGSVGTNGTYTVYPYGSQTYTLTVYGYNGQSAQCQTTVTTSHVPPPPSHNPPSCWISISYQTQWHGYNQATLTWGSQNATTASINNGVGSVSTSGSRTVSANYNAQYVMTVWGPNGTATCQTQNVVIPPPPPYNPPPLIAPFVSLTQIPYTGFGDGAVGMAFSFSMMTVAGFGAFMLARRKTDDLAYAMSTLKARAFGSRDDEEEEEALAPMMTTSTLSDELVFTETADGMPKISLVRMQ